MIEKQDYRMYLSVDNGKGLLLKEYDAWVLDQYGIRYFDYNSMKELILVIGKFIDEHDEEDICDLEEVLEHLMEMHYYYEVNK